MFSKAIFLNVVKPMICMKRVKPESNTAVCLQQLRKKAFEAMVGQGESVGCLISFNSFDEIFYIIIYKSDINTHLLFSFLSKTIPVV